MFDFTNIHVARTPEVSNRSHKPVKEIIKKESLTIEKLEEDFSRVGGDRISKNQERLKNNREIRGNYNLWDLNDFSDLRGKFDSERADEVYAEDKRAGLVSEDPKLDEFIG